MVSDQEKNLIRQGFESERMDLESFIPAFFKNFFARCPDVRTMFTGDMVQLDKKLLTSLSHMAEALDNPDRLTGILRLQGEKHRQLEVSDAHFNCFNDSFTSTLSDTLGPEWNGEMHRAWAGFLTCVAIKMDFRIQV